MFKLKDLSTLSHEEVLAEERAALAYAQRLTGLANLIAIASMTLSGVNVYLSTIPRLKSTLGATTEAEAELDIIGPLVTTALSKVFDYQGQIGVLLHRDPVALDINAVFDDIGETRYAIIERLREMGWTVPEDGSPDDFPV